MKNKIVMPAMFLRESGQQIGELWEHFSDAAQRSMVYTTQDYITILKSLIADWKINDIKGLNDKGERARDYLMNLPDRLERISQRIVVPKRDHTFKWIAT